MPIYQPGGGSAAAETDTAALAALTAHEADTTAVHGIANTVVGIYPAPPSGFALPSGRYLRAPNNITGTVNPGNGQMIANLLIVPVAATFDRFSFRVGTAGEAGSLVRGGIYNMSPATWLPSTLVLDAGTAAGDGATGIREITISQSLAAGYYYTVLCCQAAATTRPALTRSVASYIPSPWGDATGTRANDINNGVAGWLNNTTNVTSGALPSNFNAGGSDAIVETGSVPVAQLRVA